MEEKTENKIRLSNDTFKYLTNVDNNLVMKPSQNTLKQYLIYSPNGELIIDDKCLTYLSNSKEQKIMSCSNGIEQKWSIEPDGKIKPKLDNTKCLTSKYDNVVIESCNETDMDSYQRWNEEDSNSYVSMNDYSWNKYQGKTVVLVEEDNPWYINEDTTIRMNYPQPEFNKKPVSYDDMYENKNNKIETFKGSTLSPTNNFIICITILILLLLLYSYFIRNHL